MDLFMLSGYLLNKGQGNRETFKGYWEPSKFGAGLFCSGIMMEKTARLQCENFRGFCAALLYVSSGLAIRNNTCVFWTPVPLINVFSLQSKKWFIQALAIYHLIKNRTNGSASFLCLPHPTCKHKNVERTQGQEMWFLWSKLAFRICHLGGAKVLPRCLNPQKTHACKFHQPPNSG